MAWWSLFVFCFACRAVRQETSVGQSTTAGLPAGTCKFRGDAHTFIRTKHSCKSSSQNDLTSEVSEALGCNLMDYRRNLTWAQADMDYEVHWNVLNVKTGRVNPGLDLNKYRGPRICTEYNIPDYCSRAMISSLSTVYDGTLRYPSFYVGGAKVLFRSWSPVCKRDYRDKTKAKERLDRVFSGKRIAKSCWNLVNDWRHLYCSAYGQCACGPDEDCHSNPEKIQCCRDRFQEWLRSDYNLKNVSAEGYD